MVYEALLLTTQQICLKLHHELVGTWWGCFCRMVGIVGRAPAVDEICVH